MEEELVSLRSALEKEKKDRMADVNKMERDKIKATEDLRKEMLYKIVAEINEQKHPSAPPILIGF